MQILRADLPRSRACFAMEWSIHETFKTGPRFFNGSPVIAKNLRDEMSKAAAHCSFQNAFWATQSELAVMGLTPRLHEQPVVGQYFNAHQTSDPGALMEGSCVEKGVALSTTGKVIPERSVKAATGTRFTSCYWTTERKSRNFGVSLRMNQSPLMSIIRKNEVLFFNAEQTSSPNNFSHWTCTHFPVSFVQQLSIPYPQRSSPQRSSRYLQPLPYLEAGRYMMTMGTTRSHFFERSAAASFGLSLVQETPASLEVPGFVHASCFAPAAKVAFLEEYIPVLVDRGSLPVTGYSRYQLAALVYDSHKGDVERVRRNWITARGLAVLSCANPAKFVTPTSLMSQVDNELVFQCGF